MNKQFLFKDRAEEIKFWAAFGYIDDGMVYCAKCKDVRTNVKGMTNHE